MSTSMYLYVCMLIVKYWILPGKIKINQVQVEEIALENYYYFIQVLIMKNQAVC